MTERTFFSYTAGYIDGDGCFYAGTTIQKPKNITVFESSIQVLSTKNKILFEFRDAYGGFVRKKPDRLHHKEALVWVIKNSHCIPVIDSVFPFLVEKHIQASLLKQLIHSIVPNAGVKISNTTLTYRESLIQKIREEKHMKNFISKEDIDHINTLQNTVTPSDLDYPYLAGLIDSEGCFRIKKWKPKNRPNEVYNIAVEIGNTKLPILPWLIQRFGGTCTFIPAKGTKRSSATWCLSAAALFPVLHKVFPFLRGKKDVCAKLIEFQETILPNGGDRHSELFRALFEKRREIREKIIQEVHELNKKGS